MIPKFKRYQQWEHVNVRDSHCRHCVSTYVSHRMITCVSHTVLVCYKINHSTMSVKVQHWLKRSNQGNDTRLRTRLHRITDWQNTLCPNKCTHEHLSREHNCQYFAAWNSRNSSLWMPVNSNTQNLILNICAFILGAFATFRSAH